MSWFDKFAIRVCSVAVLYPWTKPLAAPFARYLLAKDHTNNG